MASIKIGFDNNGKIIHALCNKNTDCSDFFYLDEKGAHNQAKSPLIVEFNEENLKKIFNIFKEKFD